MLLSEAVEEFLNFLDREKQASSYTLKNYRHYLYKFLEFSQKEKVSRTDELNINFLQSYRVYLSKIIDPKTNAPLKKTTQNYFLISLRSFLSYLKEKGVKLISAEEVKLIKQDSGKPKTIPLDTLERLLNAPSTSDLSGLRDKAILYLLAATGVKTSELSTLNKGSVDLNNQTITTSGKKKRNLSFPSSASAALEVYLKARKDSFKPLFIRFKGAPDPSNEGEKMRLTDRSIERMVKKYTYSLGTRIDVTPQILRHSFAKTLLVQGEKLAVVKELLGHANKASTKVYEKLVE